MNTRKGVPGIRGMRWTPEDSAELYQVGAPMIWFSVA